MASYKDMKRLGDDPAAVVSLATNLLGLTDADWTDWELDFLSSMAARASESGTLTLRQREILFELEGRSKNYTMIAGARVQNLVANCCIASKELDEDDEEFLRSLKDRSITHLRKGAAIRLLQCAKQLQLVETYVWIE
jgi:hypothetical protein